MSAATETVSRTAQWALRSNARCDQKWLNSGLQVRGSAMWAGGVGSAMWAGGGGVRHVGWRGRGSPSLPSAGSSEGALLY